MLQSGGSRSRITLEQRRLMLDFIKENPSINTGRFEGIDGARVRTELLNKMANILNSQESGAIKSPEKWLRSWQDWKSDIKRKATEIARNARNTGYSGLSELERDLVELIKSTGNINVEAADPLDGPSQIEINQADWDQLIEVEEEQFTLNSTVEEESQKKEEKRKVNNGKRRWRLSEEEAESRIARNKAIANYYIAKTKKIEENRNKDELSHQILSLENKKLKLEIQRLKSIIN